MTRILKVAALQEKAMPRASIKEKMEQRTLPLIEEAAKKGAQIILATELCTTDYDRCYGAKDNDIFKEAETIPGYSTNEVAKLCKKHGVYVIFPLFEKAVPGVYYNSSATIGPDGSIVGTYRKTQVAGVQALEKMYFRAGQDFKVHETVFEPHAKFGTIICHDRRYPETSRILAMLGAEVMFCPTAAPGYAHGVHWGNLNIMRAVDNGMFCVYSNRIGQEGVNNYFGESMIVDPMGEVIASGGKEENAVVMADLDLAKVDEARIKVPTLRDMRGDFWMKYYSPTYDKLVG
ncbi:MAG: carbon-nitrogen hydrolase family protein [Paracoccaceae bacterium]|jgi:N-carbamoylputrescine amidase|nr:carbon-nitrogen hydrolase family protein [Rhodobacter sp.]